MPKILISTLYPIRQRPAGPYLCLAAFKLHNVTKVPEQYPCIDRIYGDRDRERQTDGDTDRDRDRDRDRYRDR